MADADQLSVPSAEAQQLAVLLSAAVRIEPQLMRVVRLALLPGIDVGAESDLWFSEWVGSRGTEMITLEPALLPELRRRLSGWLSENGSAVGERLYAVIERVHSDISPALRLEEEAVWLAVSGGPQEAIDEVLAPALQALVAQGRGGVTDWILGAWERLPAEVRRTRVGWQLLQVALKQRPGAEVGSVMVPDDLTAADLAPIVDAVADVRIGVRRDGPYLWLGDLSDATAQIMVPDTRPRVVELAETSDGPAMQIAVIDAGEVIRLEVGEAPFALRTGRGEVYRLDEPAGGAVSPPASEAPAAEADLESVGAARYAQYLATGDVATLDEAIELWSAVLQADGARPSLVVRLADGLRSRYRLTGSVADLDLAITLCQSMAQGTGDTRQIQLALANLLLERSISNGDVSDLDGAIGIARTVVEGSPDFLRRPALIALGSALLERARRFGDPADVDAAVQAGHALMADTHPGDSLYPAAASLAGRTLNARYRLTGRLSDLERAVRLLSAAVEAEASPSPELMVTLGALLDERFLTTGDTADLTRAVDLMREAAAQVPTGSPLRIEALQGLSTVLLHRYEQRGDTGDLDDAIEAARLVLASGFPTVSALTALGDALLRRGELDEAETVLRQALSVSSPPEPTVLVDLANVLLSLQRGDSDTSRIDEAIALADQAVSVLPEGSPARGGALTTLAEGLARRQRLARDQAAGERAIAIWREVAQNVTGPVSDRIRAARAYAELAVHMRNLDTALTGYSVAIELLPLLSWRPADRADLLILTDYAGLAQDAAACAISIGQPERALELLEHGRSLFWARLGGQRTDLSGLQEIAPALAAELGQIRNALDSGLGQPAATSGALASERLPLAQRWNELLAQVRALPGFAAFLRPPDVTALRTAAVDGPVVVINVSSLRCDAMVVTTRGVQVIPLPALSGDMVAGAAKDYRGTNLAPPRGSELNQLWDSVAWPVLKALGVSRERQPAQRIWWCSTGDLALVPMFAVEDGRTGRGVMDYVVSSSTNTLGALIRARRGATMGLPRRVLIVANPSGNLPGVLLESDVVGALLRDMPVPVEVTVLAGPDANRRAVLAAVARHQWVHFAGHGASVPDRPLDSGLMLADGMLTVADLAEQRFADAELAFLATSDTTAPELPDEAIGIAAAFQFAGFRHVITSTRSLNDRAAVDVARAFYQRLLGSTANPQPADALDAVLRLRRAQSRDVATRASYVHYGP